MYFINLLILEDEMDIKTFIIAAALMFLVYIIIRMLTRR